MHLSPMRRTLLPGVHRTPLQVIVLALLLAWGTPGIAAAHGAGTAAASNGIITGTVLNGSKDKAPVAGQKVTLEMYVSHTQTQSAATTTTDASGHFSFASLDGSGSTVYQLDVRYDNGDFTSPTIDFANGPTVSQIITVYNTTSDPSVLSVTNTTMLFSAPNTQAGMIPVGVFITFKNSSKLAFAASAAAPAGGGMPTSLLRFALPPDAQNLVLGAGFTNVQAVQVDKGFAAMATVPPGTTQFAYAYSLPYTGTDYTFQFQAVYATAAVTLLVPPNTLVDDGDYAAKPPVPVLNQQYQLLEADNVQPDEVLKMRLWDLPYPGERPDLDQRLLLIFGGILALLLALLAGLYLKRGNLAVALGILPASALARPAASRGGQDRDAERKRLLKLLLTLEKQHASGQLEDAEYQRRHTNTRRKLKALLAESISADPAILSSERKSPAKGESQSAQLDVVSEPSGAVSTASLDNVADVDGPEGFSHEDVGTTDADTAEVGMSSTAPATRTVGAQPAALAEDVISQPAKSTRRRRTLVGGRR